MLVPMVGSGAVAVTSDDAGVSLGADAVGGVVAWSVVSGDVVSSEAPEEPAAIGIVTTTAIATLTTVRRVRADVATVGSVRYSCGFSLFECETIWFTGSAIAGDAGGGGFRRWPQRSLRMDHRVRLDVRIGGLGSGRVQLPSANLNMGCQRRSRVRGWSTSR